MRWMDHARLRRNMVLMRRACASLLPSVIACAALAQAPIVDAVKSGSSGTVGAVAERQAPLAEPGDPVIQMERVPGPDLRKERSLRDALNEIGRKADVPVTGLWRKGDSGLGLDPDRVVVMEVPPSTCADALHAIADALSREGEPVTWQQARVGIEFGPRSLLWRPSAMRVKVYDVSDLLLYKPAFVSTGVPAPGGGASGGGGAGGGSGMGGGSGGGGGASSNVVDDAAAIRRAAARDDLITLIQLTVEPEAWESRGGPCTITQGQGLIVVRAPDFVHRQIESPRARPRAKPPAAPATGSARP
jgi:uncharacterized membrane protein YgcG